MFGRKMCLAFCHISTGIGAEMKFSCLQTILCVLFERKQFPIVSCYLKSVALYIIFLRNILQHLLKEKCFDLIVNSVKNNFTHDSTLLAFPFTSHALFDKWDFNFLSFHTQIPVIPFVFYKKRADFLHPKIEFQGTYTLK